MKVAEQSRGITLGRHLHKPGGIFEPIEGDDLGATLAVALQEHAGRGAWWAPGIFEADVRHGDRWRGAWTLGIDGDYYAKGLGHSPPPDQARELLMPALGCVLARALYHDTPRGFRNVLAPRAKLRPRVVPKLPDSARALRACNAADVSQPATEKRDKKKREREEPPTPRDRSGPIIPDALPISATLLARQIDGAEVPAPNVLSANHLDRIHGGLLFAATSNVPWAVLLARTFEVDIKACPRCEGRLVVRAVISDLSVARQILDSLAKNARVPPRHEKDAHDAVLVLDQDYD
jgi:hypothetical protein